MKSKHAPLIEVATKIRAEFGDKCYAVITGKGVKQVTCEREKEDVELVDGVIMWRGTYVMGEGKTWEEAFENARKFVANKLAVDKDK